MKVFAILLICAGFAVAGCQVLGRGGGGGDPTGPVEPGYAEEPAMPTDLGQQCQFSSDCQGGICFKQRKFTMYGYCSQTCTDFPDCPTWWTCGTNAENDARACEQPPAD
jgi:hypothetical protein